MQSELDKWLIICSRGAQSCPADFGKSVLMQQTGPISGRYVWSPVAPDPRVSFLHTVVSATDFRGLRDTPYPSPKMLETESEANFHHFFKAKKNYREKSPRSHFAQVQ